MEIGNGGIGGNSYLDSAAGPFYGIFPFGEILDEIIDNAEPYLSNEVQIYPNMSDTEWNELSKVINSNEDMSDDEYEKELGFVYGGILPIGSQGCSFIHGLILNGPHKGKVVNLDISRQKPIFTFEKNFLDWYERWLDEIISGDLLKCSSGWFGYVMGGTEEKLIQAYAKSKDDIEKQQILRGLLNKNKIRTESYDFLETAYSNESNLETKSEILHILNQTNPKRAKKYLLEYGEIALLPVFQCIFWYSKKNCKEWLPFITQKIATIDDEETFRFCTYLLVYMKIDFANLIIPFTKHQNPEIRQTAFYSLGLLKNKATYLDAFLVGLKDESNTIVHTTIQALSGVKNPILLKTFKAITERYPTEEDYILQNLDHRLKDYGLTQVGLRKLTETEIEEKMEFLREKINKQNAKKWYEFWK